MPRLPRPYIPLKVRLQVAERQVGFKPCPEATASSRLQGILMMLFGDSPAHLDHDPPLAARKKIKNKAGEIIGYRPAANDPNYLIYRTAGAHRLKTNVRGEHGQHPDRVLIKKNRKIERREAGVKERPKAKVRGLNFQQQRCRLGARCRCDRRQRKTCEHYPNLKMGQSS